MFRIKPFKIILSFFYFMRLALSIFCISVSLLSFSQGNVDGFFKSKGELDLAFSGNFSSSSTYFTKNGSINYKRAQMIIGAFGIYGITDKWNAIVSLPLINLKPQDASVYLKYKLFQNDTRKGVFTLAPALGISFPMSNYPTQTGQAIGQRATIIQPKLVFQYKNNKNWFIQTQGGYNYTFEPVPSSFVASFKAGYIYRTWYFDAWFDYQYGIGGTNYGIDGLNFRELGVSYNKVGGVIYRSVGEKSGIFFNGSYIHSGRNIGQAFTVSTGYVLKLKPNKKSKS